MERIEEQSKRSGRERGIALVLVLLILATTTIIGIGAVTASISDLKITANENCYNKLLNTADVGIQDSRNYLQNLKADKRKIWINGTGTYRAHPLTFFHIKNCGINTGAIATDAAAKCETLAAGGATPDVTVQLASATGGLFKVFYDVNFLHRDSKQALTAGENVGTSQSRDYLTHSFATGCGTTSNLESRMQFLERLIGGSENDYQAVVYDKAGT